MRAPAFCLLLAACGSSIAVPIDAGRADAPLPVLPDAALPDAPIPDAAILDAPIPDAAIPDAARPDANPLLLSGVGLYADFEARLIADGYREFAPTHPLWSDGLTKRRWIHLPPGTQIDTSDMDHWKFPAGTRFFKEFSLNGVILETRLIEHPDERTYKFGPYVWRADQSDADWTPAGAVDVLGTFHDVPSSADCRFCHDGDEGHILGFSAIQLSGEAGPGLLSQLAAEGLLSDPPPAGTEYPAPGDELTAAALGTLHANCGHCHNPTTNVYLAVSQILRLSVGERAPEDTETYRTAVGVATQEYRAVPYRILPGQPGMSAIYVRMTLRGEGSGQMPPIATELTDDEHSLPAVKAWIEALTN